MTSYTKTTNFTAKDALPSGDPNKVIAGSLFDTEFDDIETSINSKSNTASPTFTGTVTTPNLIVNTSATFSGATIADLGTVTTVDINGGTIDGTTIGGTTPAAGTFSSATITTADINGGSVDGAIVGATSAAAGTFTNLSATSVADFADGTAAAPSITNTGDLDTGFFFSAENGVGCTTGGTEKWRVSNDFLKVTNDGTYGGVAGISDQTTTSAHVFQSDQNDNTVRAINDNTGSGAAGFSSNLATGATGFHYIGRVNGSSVYLVAADGDVTNTNNSYGAISDPKLKNIIGSKSSTWEKNKKLQLD
jgi:hypothetical protein